MFLLIFALVLVALGALLRGTQDDVLRQCGLWLYGFAVIVALVLASTGCSSPTAPSTTLELTWGTAPGCAPGAFTKPKSTDIFFGHVEIPGTNTLLAYYLIHGESWTGVFHRVGPLYLVCTFERSEA